MTDSIKIEFVQSDRTDDGHRIKMVASALMDTQEGPSGYVEVPLVQLKGTINLTLEEIPPFSEALQNLLLAYEATGRIK